MDTLSLRAFRTVAELGNVTRAAEKLHTVQSNVTTHIKQLEASLGATLFSRHNRGVRLTPAGELLLVYAQRIERLMVDAREAVSTYCGGGSLNLGAVETVIAVRVASPVADFRRQHPKVSISLSTGTSDELVRKVLEWKLDGAFVCGPVAHQDLVCDTLFEEELGVVSAKASQEVSPDYQTLLVLREGCAYRARAEAWFRKTGQAPIRLMELTTLDGLIGLAAAGAGVTLLPRSVILRGQLEPLLDFQQLLSPDMKIPTLLVRRKDCERLVVLNSFLEVFKIFLSNNEKSFEQYQYKFAS